MNSENKYPEITSFRTRTSKLTESQTKKWDRNWDKYGFELDDLTKQNSQKLTEFNLFFKNNKKIVFEIGTGTGTASVFMAKNSLDENLVAIDVYKPGLAFLVEELSVNDIQNVRVVLGDAIKLLELVPNQSLDGIRLFFPDPWPKRKHQKRRIINEKNLNIFYSKIKKDGVLHFASDHADYSSKVKIIFKDFKGFEIINPQKNPPNITIDRPETKFERKGLDKGHEIIDIIVKRI